MGARSGNNYLSSLRKLKAEVWIGATRVADPTIHPALVRRARAIASLYDLQMEHPGRMTYRLDDGDRAGLSYIQPRSASEVVARGAMFRVFAEYNGGLLTVTPDAADASLAAMASAASFLAAGDARFGTNLLDYYRRSRHRDWCTAHAIGAPLDAAAERPLELVERVDDGLIVSGTRTSSALGPLAEELVIPPPPDLPNDPAAARFALAFGINCNAPGLALRCVPGAPTDADPFGEMPCVAIFDRVLIPWERVFLCGDVAHGNRIPDETGATLVRRHQRVVRALVAAEFRLGRAAHLAERSHGLAFPRIQTHLTANIVAIHHARALLQTAETGARPNRWGLWEPLAEPLELALKLTELPNAGPS